MKKAFLIIPCILLFNTHCNKNQSGADYRSNREQQPGAVTTIPAPDQDDSPTAAVYTWDHLLGSFGEEPFFDYLDPASQPVLDFKTFGLGPEAYTIPAEPGETLVLDMFNKALILITDKLPRLKVHLTATSPSGESFTKEYTIHDNTLEIIDTDPNTGKALAGPVALIPFDQTLCFPGGAWKFEALIDGEKTVTRTLDIENRAPGILKSSTANPLTPEWDNRFLPGDTVYFRINDILPGQIFSLYRHDNSEEKVYPFITIKFNTALKTALFSFNITGQTPTGGYQVVINKTICYFSTFSVEK